MNSICIGSISAAVILVTLLAWAAFHVGKRAQENMSEALRRACREEGVEPPAWLE